MADQTDTYTVKIMTDAQNALQQLEQMRISIDAFKARIKDLAQTSGEDFNKVAEAIRRATEEARKAAEKDLLNFLKGKTEITPEELAAAQAPVQKLDHDYKALGYAVRELSKEQKLAADSAKKFGGDASLAATAYMQRINELKNSMMQLAQQQNITLQQAARGMQIAGIAPAGLIGQAQRELTQEANATVAFLNAMKGIDAAATQTKTGIAALTNQFSQLGQVGKFVFGTVLGVGAIQVIRNLINVFKEAIQEGLKFQQTLFTFEVAVRGLQRMGMANTLEEWRGLIESIKDQFPIFPREQITESVALAGLMTREFGFTAEQISEVVRMSAVLAELTGKDLHESVRGITYAIGSGYFESLQRVGINISRQIVAEEALRQGYEGSYTALDQNVRAMITYNIIQKNLAAVQSDAGKIMETSAGQVRAVQAAWKDLLAAIGLIITDSEELIDTLRDISKFINLVRDSLVALDNTVGTSTFFKWVTNPPAGASSLFFDIFKWMSKLDFNIDKITYADEQFQIFVQRAKNGIQLIIDTWLDWIGKIPLIGPALKESLQNLTKAEDILGNLPSPEEGKYTERLRKERAYREKILDIADDLNQELADLEADAALRRKELLTDHLRDMQQLWVDYQRRIADLGTDYERDLADIDTKRLQDIEDENRDYANSAAEAAQESADRRADAERKYRDQELIAELRFQERMRQLREGFLFDLEDAVRERDARQIIRLTRQYNMERNQLIREEEISKKERWLAYQRQLQDIDRQKRERMNRLYQEHVQRLQEIDIQAERERQRALLEFERKKQDEELRYQQEKQDRNTRYKDQLADLDKNLQDRINETAQKLLEEHKVTAEWLDLIAREYENVYGPNGRIDRAFQYYFALLKAASGIGGTPRYGEGYKPPVPPSGKHAEGGSKIVTKPTYELFGEAGPEMVTFTPLSRAGVDVGRVQGNAPAGMKAGGGNGRLLLEVRLDDGLEYRIVDQAMGELADVITRIERARK